MGKRILYFAVSLALINMLLLPVFALAVDDYNPLDPFGVNRAKVNALATDKTPAQLMVQIINIALGFLGLIAVLVMLLAGFKWLTAGGNEEKVGEARQLLLYGLLGLIIIFSAWAVTRFVIEALTNTLRP
jgi:hypothetical protein